MNRFSSKIRLVENSSVNRGWLTPIVIPTISNAAKQTNVIVVSSKGKLDLAMSVAARSCVQIPSFSIPVLTVSGS